MSTSQSRAEELRNAAHMRDTLQEYDEALARARTRHSSLWDEIERWIIAVEVTSRDNTPCHEDYRKNIQHNFESTLPPLWLIYSSYMVNDLDETLWLLDVIYILGHGLYIVSRHNIVQMSRKLHSDFSILNNLHASLQRLAQHGH